MTKKETIMQIKDYPYGKPTKTLSKAVKWLMSNKKRLSKTQLDDFDYPDYWGMPKNICSKLSGDAVDWLQEETYDWWQDNYQRHVSNGRIISALNDTQKQAILAVFKISPWEMMEYVSSEFANDNYEALTALDFSDQL